MMGRSGYGGLIIICFFFFLFVLSPSITLQGENDIDQLCCVLRVLGTPNESIWPVSMEVTYDYPNTLGPRSVRIITVPVCETTLFCIPSGVLSI